MKKLIKLSESDLINIVEKVIKEQVSKEKGYKFAEGGYLIPADIHKGDVFLTDEKFHKLKKLNDNIKELYELEVHKLSLIKKHNKGVILHAIDKIK
jgi:hypothetical protein